MTRKPPVRVLITDDSGAMRLVIRSILERLPGIEVVGCASDAHEARELIKSLAPDVLTLDVQMPGMDGLTFLERLMRLRPMPVVMVSALTREGSETTLRALELGAIDVVAKPRLGDPGGQEAFAAALGEKILAAAMARVRRPAVSAGEPAPASAPPLLRAGGGERPGPAARAAGRQRVICVGASTGGTEAIRALLQGMPADCPPVLVVQHMPESFTQAFARRLDDLVAPRVIESAGGEALAAGTVYIAPGHSHLLVERAGGGVRTRLAQTPPVNHHRPSVDVLFDSAARVLGGDALGVILTGMGRDGASGLLRLREAGAPTFGQDEASCVIYGMPREAARIGAVAEVVSLPAMAGRVLAALRAEAVA